MLTQARLNEVLTYDPATGIFRWRISTSNRRAVGSVAGCKIDQGYVVIGIDGALHMAHRLAWLYVHGEFPAGDLDHRDLCKDHNWLDNLRPATRSQNNANSKPPRHNKSGIKGVSFHKQTGKWRASIVINRKQRHLGLFERIEDAAAAYAAEAKSAFGQFARAA